MPIRRPTEILIRRATAADELELAHLAALDSAPCPPADAVLVAELDGELKIAMSLEDGSVIADPFTYTADLVPLLALRAAAFGTRARRAQRGRRLPNLAALLNVTRTA